MSWELGIEHVTRVAYPGPVLASFNEARMTPATLPGQETLKAEVAVGPGAASVRTYRDRWSTRVTAFDLTSSHDELTIRATATVRTSPARLPGKGGADGWDTVRGTVRRAATGSRLMECCLPTRLTALDPRARKSALSGVGKMPPSVAAETIADRVRERVAFMPGATGVGTGAQEAWEKGQGVCQDLAHATVALLRAAGLPARYVSGYLHPNPDAEPGDTGEGQSHAWAEYWAGEWFGLDPTSGTPASERHVVVAYGRDYADVPPLKGYYQGPPPDSTNVTVRVTRLA